MDKSWKAPQFVQEKYVIVSKSAREIKNGIKALINSARKRKIIKRKQNK